MGRKSYSDVEKEDEVRKTITEDEANKLVSLEAAVKAMKDAEDYLLEIAEGITGEERDNGSFTFDYIFNDLSLEELLDLLQIEVEVDV